MKQSDSYSSLNTTIGIHFLDFAYFKDKRVSRHFMFKDAQTNEAPDELNCVQLCFVEMPKFDKDWSELSTPLDRWVSFLNRAQELSTLELPQALASEPAIVKAVSELDRIGLDPEEREIYEGEVKALMLDAIQLKTVREEGIQQGMQQGRHVMLANLMTRRFGEVPSTINSSLGALSDTQLDELAVALFDLSSYTDVAAWIQRQ